MFKASHVKAVMFFTSQKACKIAEASGDAWLGLERLLFPEDPYLQGGACCAWSMVAAISQLDHAPLLMSEGDARFVADCFLIQRLTMELQTKTPLLGAYFRADPRNEDQRSKADVLSGRVLFRPSQTDRVQSACIQCPIEGLQPALLESVAKVPRESQLREPGPAW